MSFLSPLWLWVAAAALVPIAIHLLSRGRGRVVPVGTIRFLPAAHSHRLRKIRPSGLLRLLLRTALIASLALALAAPRYWSVVLPAPGDRWLLIDPSLVAQRQRLEAGAPDIFQRLDDSVATQRRLLAPGLPAWNGEAVTATGRLDLWSLVAEAAALAPPETVLEIFALDRAEALRGARPDLGRPVEWWTVPDADPNRWIQRLVPTPDGPWTTIGTSTAEGTRFVSGTFSATSAELPGLRLGQAEGPDTLSLIDGGSRQDDDVATLPLGLPPLRISVLAGDGRGADAVVVRQAAAAVAAHLGRPLVLATEPGEAVDLLIGLGATPRRATAASVRILDGDADALPCQQLVYVDALPNPWLELSRCAVATAESAPAMGAARWRDAWGRPLLSLESSTPDVAYRWNGRLDPAWSSLADSGLPHLLLALVAPDDEHANGASGGMSDNRVTVAGQSRPRSSEMLPSLTPNRLPERIAWALVALLFLVDRLLVRRAS